MYHGVGPNLRRNKYGPKSSWGRTYFQCIIYSTNYLSFIIIQINFFVSADLLLHFREESGKD